MGAVSSSEGIVHEDVGIGSQLQGQSRSMTHMLHPLHQNSSGNLDMAYHAMQQILPAIHKYTTCMH
jgi:hypothetical protein